MGNLHIISCIGIAGIISLSSCQSKKEEQAVSAFSEVDSLTELYLGLQDSILYTWNQMINDDNQKIKSMQTLLQELHVVGQVDPEQLHALENRISQLKDIRYTPKTLANTNVIEDYDFASNSLVTELITLAESHAAYTNNATLQAMVEDIRTAEQRIENYRVAYDGIVTKYNHLLNLNKDVLMKNGQNIGLDNKPLFQVVSE